MHAECAHPVGLHACIQTCKDTSTVGRVKCSHANAESHLNELLAVRCDKWPAVSAGANAARTHWMRWDQSRTHPEMLQGGMRLGTDEATKIAFGSVLAHPHCVDPFASKIQLSTVHTADMEHDCFTIGPRDQYSSAGINTPTSSWV